MAPAQNKELVAALAAQGVTSLGLDCIPRMLSRAQAFDVLSSQAVRIRQGDGPERGPGQ